MSYTKRKVAVALGEREGKLNITRDSPKSMEKNHLPTKERLEALKWRINSIQRGNGIEREGEREIKVVLHQARKITL